MKLKCLTSSTHQRIVLVLVMGDLCKLKRLGYTEQQARQNKARDYVKNPLSTLLLYNHYK